MLDVNYYHVLEDLDDKSGLQKQLQKGKTVVEPYAWDHFEKFPNICMFFHENSELCEQSNRTNLFWGVLTK